MNPFYDQQSIKAIQKEELEHLQQFRQRNQNKILKTVFSAIVKPVNRKLFKARAAY